MRAKPTVIPDEAGQQGGLHQKYHQHQDSQTELNGDSVDTKVTHWKLRLGNLRILNSIEISRGTLRPFLMVI